MMLKEKSHPWARLKYVCFAPVAFITVMAFAHPDVNQLEQRSTEQFKAVLNQDTPTSIDGPIANKGTNNQTKFTAPPVKNDLADSKPLKDAKPLKDTQPLKDAQLLADNQQKPQPLPPSRARSLPKRPAKPYRLSV